MKSLIGSMLVVLTLGMHAQMYTSFTPSGDEVMHHQTAEVSAKSGVILRSEPSTRAASLGKIKHGETVSVFQSDRFPEETIEGHTARWVKVCHKGKCGYVFSGFITTPRTYAVHFPEVEPQLNTAENQVVAVCFSQEHGYYTLLIEASALSSTEGWNRARCRELGVLFVVEGVKSVGRIHEAWFGSCEILPGELADLAGQALTASGSTELRNGTLTLANYKLMRWNSEAHLELEVLARAADLALGYSGIPELRWFGDLDGDGKADLIMQFETERGMVNTLMLSGLAEYPEPYRCVALSNSEIL
ncbi:MAG: SH3 domain-containing protein [Flavobacteriales bacterium]|nr:SH3 domain-containing protein [Flavobacteriales bacterium]